MARAFPGAKERRAAIATSTARAAGSNAYEKNTPEAHQKAATEHMAAAEAHTKATTGAPNDTHRYAATSHIQAAQLHKDTAYQLRQQAPKESFKPSGGLRARLGGGTPQVSNEETHKTIGTRPLGIEPKTPKTVANRLAEVRSAHGVTPQAKEDLAKARQNSVSDPANKAKSLSDTAAEKSARATTKPSLVSHSAAAKAHEEAAASHLSNGNKAEASAHQDKANYHRETAHHISNQIRQKRIAKIKVEGPGQHHGADGKFQAGR